MLFPVTGTGGASCATRAKNPAVQSPPTAAVPPASLADKPDIQGKQQSKAGKRRKKSAATEIVLEGLHPRKEAADGEILGHGYRCGCNDLPPNRTVNVPTVSPAVSGASNEPPVRIRDSVRSADASASLGR